MTKSLQHEQRGVLKLEKELLVVASSIATLSASAAKAESLLGSDITDQTNRVVDAYLHLVGLVQSTHAMMNERAISASVSLMQIDGTPKDKPPLAVAMSILGLS